MDFVPGVVAYTFNPALRKQGLADLYESEANLVYRVSIRIARGTLPQRWGRVCAD